MPKSTVIRSPDTPSASAAASSSRKSETGSEEIPAEARILPAVSRASSTWPRTWD